MDYVTFGRNGPYGNVLFFLQLGVQFVAETLLWCDWCVDNNTCYAKLLSANTTHIQSIIDAERTQLQKMLDDEEETVRLAVLLMMMKVVEL